MRTALPALLALVLCVPAACAPQGQHPTRTPRVRVEIFDATEKRSGSDTVGSTVVNEMDTVFITRSDSRAAEDTHRHDLDDYRKYSGFGRNGLIVRRLFSVTATDGQMAGTDVSPTAAPTKATHAPAGKPPPDMELNGRHCLVITPQIQQDGTVRVDILAAVPFAPSTPAPRNADPTSVVWFCSEGGRFHSGDSHQIGRLESSDNGAHEIFATVTILPPAKG